MLPTKIEGNAQVCTLNPPSSTVCNSNRRAQNPIRTSSDLLASVWWCRPVCMCAGYTRSAAEANQTALATIIAKIGVFPFDPLARYSYLRYARQARVIYSQIVDLIPLFGCCGEPYSAGREGGRTSVESERVHARTRERARV